MYTASLWVILIVVLIETAGQAAAGATSIVAVVIEKCTGQPAAIAGKIAKCPLNQAAANRFFAATVLRKTAERLEDSMIGIIHPPEDQVSKDHKAFNDLNIMIDLRRVHVPNKITTNLPHLMVNSTA